MSEKVTAGLADFAEPTLLLIGSAAGLRALADLFSSEVSAIPLLTNALLMPIGIKLNLHLRAPQTKLAKVGNQIDWYISPADAKAYGELVRAVAESDKPSHTYLDMPKNNELGIVVSKDEYDPKTVFIS